MEQISLILPTVDLLSCLTVSFGWLSEELKIIVCRQFKVDKRYDLKQSQLENIHKI